MPSVRLSEQEVGWGRRPGTFGWGSRPLYQSAAQPSAPRSLSLQYQLSGPALMDEEHKVNLSACACSTFLTLDCNYEIWASLCSLQPDGISIFQLPNEIRPQSNGGWREGSKFVMRQSHFRSKMHALSRWEEQTFEWMLAGTSGPLFLLLLNVSLKRRPLLQIILHPCLANTRSAHRLAGTGGATFLWTM